MSKYGIACDNILTAELVLADGRLVKASTRENPEVYRAIRGGGGNFGQYRNDGRYFGRKSLHPNILSKFLHTRARKGPRMNILRKDDEKM